MDDETATAVDRFNDAFARHDIDAIMSAMTPDCVFEDTTPPDGTRHHGQAAVRTAWSQFFGSAPDAVFETEDSVIAGDRAIIRWTYRWGTGDRAGHIRGVDIIVVRDGKIAEKASYVKG